MKLLSKKFNFNLKIKNKHKIVPLVYAFAVTFAFILSLTKNKDVSASVNPYDQIPVSELEAGIEEKLDNSPDSYVKDSLENIKSLFELVNYGSSEKVVDKEITVEKGDTFISLFTDLGLTYKEAHDIYETVKKVYNPSLLRVGQKIKLRTKINIQSQTVISVESILIEPNSGIRHILTKNEKQQYIVTTQRDELTDEVNSASGIISGSLSGSMAKHGVPRRLVADFIKIFSYSVDFRRDLRKGDRFEIIYENRIAPDGKVVKTGNILYAALKLRNDKISLYRFSDKYGNVDYYNEKGQAMKNSCTASRWLINRLAFHRRLASAVIRFIKMSASTGALTMLLRAVRQYMPAVTGLLWLPNIMAVTENILKSATIRNIRRLTDI